jgi:hypothetical protein
MGDDIGTGIQNQNLIGDDVAEEINAALGEQMNGSVTPPTVVKPTHSSPPITADSDQPDDSAAQPTQGDQPAQDEPPAEPDQPVQEPAEEPHAEPPAEEPAAPSEPPSQETSAGFNVPDDERGSGNASELFDIKQQALTQLSPLVQHLDQNPEERFETILMMLRASDDPSLVKAAFDAAQAIQDDKKKAQALLDVVNEVNYLTRPQTEQ